MGEYMKVVKEEVDEDMELKENTDVFEPFIDERDEYSIKNDESNSNSLDAKVHVKQLTSAPSTKETAAVLHSPLSVVYDGVKVEEKLGVLDVFEQFTDEKGVHEREEYVIKNEQSNTNFLDTRANANQSISAPFSKEIPQVLKPPLDMLNNDVKLEYEKLINEGFHEKYENSQIDTDEENDLEKNTELDGFSSRKDNRNIQLESIKNVKKHKCSFCEYSASKKGHITRHVESIHLNIKKFKCHLCKYSSYYKNDLEKHTKSMHSNVNFCESSENGEKSTHLNAKKYKCPLCEYSAARKSSIEIHVKSIHLNTKEYQCHLCDHATSRRGHLRRHIDTVHWNGKKHKCHLCDYVASRNDHLNSHVESVHSDVKGHKCHLCDHASSRKDQLRVHIRSVHSKEQ